MPRGGGGSTRGYKPGGVYQRPDSRMTRCYEALRLATTESGHALTVGEWREACRRMTGEAPAHLSGIASCLRRRGLVIATAGRTRTVQYYTAAAPVPPRSVETIHDTVASIVREACHEANEAVDLSTILRRLIDRGVMRTSDQVGHVLKVLTSEGTRRSHAGWRPVCLEVLTVRGAHSARDRRYWRPVGSAYEAPAAGDSSRRAHIRAMAQETAEALGWVASAVEMRAWACAHPEHPAVAGLNIRPGRGGSHFGPELRGLATTPMKRTGRPDLGNFSSALATDGGVPLRAGPLDMPIGPRATARFLDLTVQLKPSDELASCARLRDEAAAIRAPALAELAEFRSRRTLMAIQDEMAIACGGDDVPWGEIADRLTRGARALRRWWGATADRTHRAVPRWITDAEAARRALPLIRAALPVQEDGLELGLAGGLGGCTLTTATAWATELLRAEGRGPGAITDYLGAVRRFPNPRCDKGPLYDETREPLSLLDVGDVLDVLSRVTSHTELSVLLRTAVDVMGYAVRDPGLLRWLLTNLPKHESLYRQGAVVALGAIGSAVSPDDVVRDAHDLPGLNAYALAIALTPMSTQDRMARIDSVVATLGRAARSWAVEVLDRLAEGSALGVIM